MNRRPEIKNPRFLGHLLPMTMSIFPSWNHPFNWPLYFRRIVSLKRISMFHNACCFLEIIVEKLTLPGCKCYPVENISFYLILCNELEAVAEWLGERLSTIQPFVKDKKAVLLNSSRATVSF